MIIILHIFAKCNSHASFRLNPWDSWISALALDFSLKITRARRTYLGRSEHITEILEHLRQSDGSLPSCAKGTAYQGWQWACWFLMPHAVNYHGNDAALSSIDCIFSPYLTVSAPFSSLKRMNRRIKHVYPQCIGSRDQSGPFRTARKGPWNSIVYSDDQCS